MSKALVCFSHRSSSIGGYSFLVLFPHIHINVICLIWLQLILLVITEHALSLILKVLFGIHQCFAPMLSFSLRGRHGVHSLGFSLGIFTLFIVRYKLQKKKGHIASITNKRIYYINYWTEKSTTQIEVGREREDKERGRQTDRHAYIDTPYTCTHKRARVRMCDIDDREPVFFSFFFFCPTICFLIIHHNTKFGLKWLSGSGDIVRTKSDTWTGWQMNRCIDGQTYRQSDSKYCAIYA